MEMKNGTVHCRRELYYQMASSSQYDSGSEISNSLLAIASSLLAGKKAK